MPARSEGSSTRSTSKPAPKTSPEKGDLESSPVIIVKESGAGIGGMSGLLIVVRAKGRQTECVVPGVAFDSSKGFETPQGHSIRKTAVPYADVDGNRETAHWVWGRGLRIL